MDNDKNITYPAKFVEWVASRAYLDVRGKYRVYKTHIEDPGSNIKTVAELYAFYLKIIA